MKRVVLGLSCALCFVYWSCADDSAAQRQSSKIMEEEVDDAEEAQMSTDGLEIRRFDLNKDKKPDLLKYLKPGAASGEEIIVRKEYDLNFDGNIDLWRFYSDDGKMIREKVDYDFDGKVDANTFFEDGVITRQEWDLNFDGKPDRHKYFEKGVIARIESDTNYDDKIDQWEYFEKGSLDRIGIDRDGDGAVDDWKKLETPEQPS